MIRDGEEGLALDCHQLAELSRCGAPLVHALRCVAELQPATQRGGTSRWSRLADAVEGGQALSDAMASLGAPFAGELAARVRAGEASGALAGAFDDMERSLQRRGEHRARLRRALVYPVFAAMALLAALGFLLLHVVPVLADGMPSSDPRTGTTGLPWHAAPLLALSSATTGSGTGSGSNASRPVALALFGACVVGSWWAQRAWRRRSGSARIGPGLASRIGRRVGAGTGATLELSRILSTVSRLHRDGVPLDEALILAARGCRSNALAVDLAGIARAIRGGATFGEAVARSRAFPPLLHRFVAAGESSGALDAALERAAVSLERDALRSLERREALAGPLVLTLAGALLLWIIVSIVLPVYDAALQGALA